MFIGHFGLALAAKKLAPKTSLGTLILAADFVDLLWPIFLLLDIEQVRIVPGITRMSPLAFVSYPFTHSLAMVLLWSLVVAGLYFGLRGYPRGAWMVGLLVLSHWFLDFLVHRPDLLLWPGGGIKLGLGIWNSAALTIISEVLCFGIGIWLYIDMTRPVDNAGKYALWSMLIFLFVAWAGSMLGGAPPSEAVVAWGAMAVWILVPWGWWIDNHRTLREGLY
jgi:hypothetical protein